MSAETPDINDPRIARARAMREAGAETAEIARACGVTVSTIYRWAEAHGFRVRDLEAAAWDAAGRGVGTASVCPASPHTPPRHPKTPFLGSDGKNRSCHDDDDGWRREDGKTRSCHDEEGEAGESGADITPEQWGQMARTLKQRALALTEAGRLRQAEQALRLAERYDRMRASAPPPQKNDGVDYHALLEKKLTRLQQHLRERAGLKEGEDFTDAHREALGIKPLPPEYGG